MALEDHYLLGRHVCGECNERQRQRCGCRKPGMDYEPRQAFRLSSPMMCERGEDVLRECPTGFVLRNAPYVYRFISAANHAESGALNPMTLSACAREALSVVGSERARLMEAQREKSREQSDSAYARRALRSHHG